MGFIRGLFKTLIFLVALVVVVALFLPASTTVTRSLTIQAAPARVFELVNGFAHFNRFSPWHNADPQTRYSYTGPPAGVGARMEWDSDNPNVGQGSSQIIAVETNRKVTTRLDFGGQGDAIAWFALQPVATDTEVTWGLRSDAGFDPLARYFNLLLDYFVGKDYEQGLRQLKILAEADPVTGPNPLDAARQGVRLVEQPARKILSLNGRANRDYAAISAALSLTYRQLGTAGQAAGLNIEGAPYVVSEYMTDEHYVYTAAVPVSGNSDAAVLPGDVELKTVTAGQAACAYHQGNADTIATTHQQIVHWMAEQGYLVAGPARERYLPEQSDASARQIGIQVCIPALAGNLSG